MTPPLLSTVEPSGDLLTKIYRVVGAQRSAVIVFRSQAVPPVIPLRSQLCCGVRIETASTRVMPSGRGLRNPFGNSHFEFDFQVGLQEFRGRRQPASRAGCPSYFMD